MAAGQEPKRREYHALRGHAAIIYAFSAPGKLNAGGLYRRTATRRQGKSVYLEYRRYSSGKPEANRVQMAFRSALKLLYRPEGLAGNPQQAYRHLIWSLTPDGATVRNPTPYYVTLFLLRANERAQDNAGVVAPFATRQTDWCRHTVRCTVRWQSINDYGRVMTAQTVDLTRIH